LPASQPAAAIPALVPARPKSNRPFTSADYELIQDEKALDEWIDLAIRAGTVAFDCETDTLEGRDGRLAGVSNALPDGPWSNVNSPRRRAAYLPLGHRERGTAQGSLDLGGAGEANGDGRLMAGQIPLETAIAKLKPLLEDPAILKVGRN